VRPCEQFVSRRRSPQLILPAPHLLVEVVHLSAARHGRFGGCEVALPNSVVQRL
jgi:hypothetical protein